MINEECQKRWRNTNDASPQFDYPYIGVYLPNVIKKYPDIRLNKLNEKERLKNTGKKLNMIQNSYWIGLLPMQM
jgi:hypothetical protein